MIAISPRPIPARSDTRFHRQRDGRCRTSDIGGARIVRREQHLHRAGDPIDHPWLVVAGTFKSYLLKTDGDEQVLDFHTPGDIIGVEAMVQENAQCSIVALDTCNVRPLSMDDPAADFEDPESDTRKIIEAMYGETMRLMQRLQMISDSTEQRLARYLLEFSEVQRRRGLKPCEFRLPMRRRDLALYLNLATETLSRAFTRLRNRGLLAVDNYEIRILDAEGLRAVVEQRRAQDLPRFASS